MSRVGLGRVGYDSPLTAKAACSRFRAAASTHSLRDNNPPPLLTTFLAPPLARPLWPSHLF